MEEKNIALLGFVSSAADYLKEQIKDDSEEIKSLEEVDLNKIKSELENKLGSSFDGAKNKSDDLINAGREVFDNFISKSPTLIDEFKDIFDVDFKKENDEKDEKIVSHLINILKKPQENDETDELVNQIAKAASKTSVETKPKVETDNTEEDKELDSIFSEILANENIEEDVADSLDSDEDQTLNEASSQTDDEPKLDPNEIKQLIKDTISEFFIDKKQEAEVKLDEVIDSFEELKNAVENPVNEEQTDLNQEDEQIDLNPIDEDVELEEVKYEELNPNNDSLLGGIFKRVDQPQEIEEPVLEETAIIEDVFVDDGSLEGENDESLDLELEDDDLKLATSQLEDEVNNEQTSDSFITVDDILNSFNAPKVDDDAEINSVLKEAENNYLVNYESSYEESVPKKKNKDNDSEEIVLNDFNIEEAIEKEFLEIQNRKVETEEPKKTNDDDYSFVDGVLVSEAELEEESFKPVEEETISNVSLTEEGLSSNKEAELEEELNEETPVIEETLGSTVDEDSNAIEEIVDSNLADEALNLAEEEMNTVEETKASSDELQEKKEEESDLEVDLNSVNEEAGSEEVGAIEESSEEIETSDDEIAQEQEDIDEDLIEEAIEDQEDALKSIAKEESNPAFEGAFGAEVNSEDSDIEEPVDSNLEKEKLEDLADLETLDLIFEELSKEHEEEYNSDYKELDADEESTNPSDELKDDTNLIEETSSEEADTNEESDSLESEVQEASEEMQSFDDEINQEQEEVETVKGTEASSDDLQENNEQVEPSLEELDTEKQDDSGLDNESLDSNEAEYSSSNLDEEFTLGGCDIEESLEEMANKDNDDISLFDDVPLSQKLSSFTDQYEASDNPYSRDVGYPVDKDDYAFEVAREHGDDSISSFLKELKENKEQDFSQQANDIVADLIDQCKTLCPDVKEEETELVEEENEPIMIDNDYIEAYKNRTLEEIYIPNPGLDALEEETVEDSSTIEEESNLEDTEETREEVEDNSNEDAYLNDLFADFTNNDYEVDEVNDKQKQEEAKRKEIYDSIVALYPYLSNGFIKGVYDLKQSFANDYKDGKKMVILHRLRFENINGLRQFVDVMINHGYLVNVDEKQMIVDTFKEHVNSDGKILTDIFEIANQAKLLTGDYEGYRIIEDEL